VKQIEPNCGEPTNMKCFDFLPTLLTQPCWTYGNKTSTHSIVDFVGIIGILNAIEIDIKKKTFSHTHILVLFMLGYSYMYM
jgi:hypothetical protein